MRPLQLRQSLAAVLFGDESPAGRLPFSIPRSVTQLGDYLNFSMVVEPFGRTFVWMRGKGSQQLHEYGFGLSYARFAYSGLALSGTKLPYAATTVDVDVAPSVVVNVSVTYVRRVASDEVVQVYSNWTVADASAMRVPVRQLVGFVRVRGVAPGEKRGASIVLKPKDYALVNSEGERVLPAGSLTLSVGGSQPTAYSAAAGAAPGAAPRVAAG